MARQPRYRFGVVGSGGREDEIVEAIKRDYPGAEIYAIPGNDGMESVERVMLKATDAKGIAAFARKRRLHLVIPGPEDAIYADVAGELERVGVPCCAPSKKAGEIVEGDKDAFKREVLIPCGIPTPAYEVFTDPALVLARIHELGPEKCVLKAAYPAAGKGVKLFKTFAEARDATHDLMVDPESKYKGAGRKVLVEEKKRGWELSATGLLDGTGHFRLLKFSCDHKREGEGDTGEMTGGMGTHTFDPPVEIARKVESYYARIAERMRQIGCPYKGVLYLGLMVDEDGEVWVLEGNCRFGDPEAQVVLPVVAGVKITDLCLAAATGNLAKFGVVEQKNEAFCLTLCDTGYPGPAQLDIPLTWIAEVRRMGVDVLLTSVKRHPRGVLTSNYAGRVAYLRVVARDLRTARRLVYRAARKAAPRNRKMQLKYRRDIGEKVAKTA